jgi:signal transduction histidine kinase
LSKLWIRSRLRLKVAMVAAAALLAAFAVFLLLSDLVIPRIISGERFESYWSGRADAAVERLQRYVTENDLTADAALRDRSWADRRSAVSLVLAETPDLSLPEELPGALPQTGRPVQCADGVVYAFACPSGRSTAAGRYISLAAAVSCFFLILLPYAVHIIRRITDLSSQMEILAGGDLNYHIAAPGQDELAQLGRGIEEMRQSVLDQMTRENETVLENSRLITSLSHDLRTPLTKMIGYLELLDQGRVHEPEDIKHYLSSALDRAIQMQDMSDRMFRHFQIGPSAGTMRLLVLLSEFCGDLRAAGFDAETPENAKGVILAVPALDLQRMFDNLFSNIKKYADPAAPVTVTVALQTDDVEVQVANRILRRANAESHGVGLNSVRQIAARSGGRMEVSTADGTFFVRLFFPVAAVERSS